MSTRPTQPGAGRPRRPAWASRLDAGSPYPLGATPDGVGVNFAVFSANAESVELCLFDPQGRHELARMPLPECTDEVWHGYLPGAGPGLVYGLRAHGPYRPEQGHRFNPHKLLLDPYARQLTGEPTWSDALFGYRPGGARADLGFDRRDSAPFMPKCVVAAGHDARGQARPQVPWEDTVIYEAHLRGLTMLRQDLPQDGRGSFAQLGDPRFIDHLRRVGVTALELLPVHAFVHDRQLLERGLANYWGYNTIGYFAPHPAYLSSGSLQEMRGAVRRLHAAGIEVILDVVYNHTAEGNELGPTLSMKGLDNASYYRLVPGDERHYINDTGCGNTLNLSHPRVLQLVLDSLRWWVQGYGIDGFRFDLGVTLGREGTGFDPGSGFFDAIGQDPVLSRCKLISEPWDLGPGGYQLGNHPPGFAEWNDRYRDSVRRFWRGDSQQRADLADRIAGTGSLFNRRRRKAWSSINFVAAHDGFTLADVVRYEGKHNEANGEDNRDGSDDNHSANWGVEGDSDDPAVQELRARMQRAMLATLLLSKGTPMLLGGDELGRSQQGNNNAYCQDNEISWIDWSKAAAGEGRALTRFVARLAAIRRRYPALRSAQFADSTQELAPGLHALDWFDERGVPLAEEDWQNPEGRALAVRRAMAGPDSTPEIVWILLNGDAQPLRFEIPGPGGPWRLLLDTAQPQAQPRPLEESQHELQGRSVAVLANAGLDDGDD